MLVWLLNSLPPILPSDCRSSWTLFFQCLPYKNINPDFFFKDSSTEQLACNNIHREYYTEKSIKKHYETCSCYTFLDSCNKGLVASWADNSMQYMFKISWWIYPPWAFSNCFYISLWNVLLALRATIWLHTLWKKVLSLALLVFNLLPH